MKETSILLCAYSCRLSLRSFALALTLLEFDRDKRNRFFGKAMKIWRQCPFRGHSKLIGLAEFVNFPGVMAAAANRLGDLQGGLVVVDDGQVTGDIALALEGLISLEPYEALRDGLRKLRQAAYALCTTLEEPFLQVTFLPLPVIPHLKISDRGMIDVDRFEFIS